MICNLHTHTKRCRHAEGEDREYVLCAIEGGLKIFGFSDHAPYLFPNTDYYSTFRMKKEELFEYADSVLSLKKEYERDVMKGLDIEEPKNYFRNASKTLVVPNWFSTANIIYSNWLNYYVYQVTPYDRSKIQIKTND